MLPTNARVCAVLDKQKHIEQVVPNSWLKDDVFQHADTDHWTPSGCSARYLASLTPCSQVHQALGAPRGAGVSWSRAGLHQLRLRLNHRYSTE